MAVVSGAPLILVVLAAGSRVIVATAVASCATPAVASDPHPVSTPNTNTTTPAPNTARAATLVIIIRHPVSPVNTAKLALSLPVGGAAGHDEVASVIAQGCSITESNSDSGNFSCRGLAACRPEVLRPHLSDGFAFGMRGLAHLEGQRGRGSQHLQWCTARICNRYARSPK